MTLSEATLIKPTGNKPTEAAELGIGALHSKSGSKHHIRGKNWTESKNKEVKMEGSLFLTALLAKILSLIDLAGSVSDLTGARAYTIKSKNSIK